jgi:hypothetical protein
MSYVQIQPGGKANSKGAKYVNLAWNEWDPGRRRSVQRRGYVGRIAPGGDEVLVNKRLAGRADLRVPLSEVGEHATSRADFEAWLRTRCGADAGAEAVARVDIAGDAWLIRHLCEASGLGEALGAAFGPVDGGALAGLAAHQFATGHALYRAEAWLSQREVPPEWRGALVSESAVHGFVARVGADAARREDFLARWAGRHASGRAIVFDTTSVSSHSPSLDLAEWGYNRDARAARGARKAHARGQAAQDDDGRRRARRTGQGQGAHDRQGQPRPARSLQEGSFRVLRVFFPKGGSCLQSLSRDLS